MYKVLLLSCFGLLCLSQINFAQQNAQSACEIHRAREEKSKAPLRLVPNCASNGDYLPLQCHQNTKRKMCQCWTPDGSIVKGPSKEVKTCECFLAKDLKINSLPARDRNAPPPGMYLPQCRINGTFNNPQCHGSTGMCWCVDSTGQQVGDQVRGELTCK